MKFTLFDGREFKDVTHNQLIKFFVEHVFDQFMEHGRKGIIKAAGDMADNVPQWYLDNGKIKTTKISHEKNEELKSWIAKQLVDGFIQDGSRGLEGAIHNSLNHIFVQFHS